MARAFGCGRSVLPRYRIRISRLDRAGRTENRRPLSSFHVVLAGRIFHTAGDEALEGLDYTSRPRLPGVPLNQVEAGASDPFGEAGIDHQSADRAGEGA